MKKKKRLVLNVQIGVVACILLVGCRQNIINRTDEIAVIDVVNNLRKYQLIPVSQFISEFEYIPLENSKDCLIKDISDIIVTTSHIFIASNDYCYAFDRDGRFISQIGRIGQGPGEYVSIVGVSIDKKNQFLYLETFHTVLEYSWDGVFRQSINKPKSMNETSLESVFFVRDNLFIGHVANYSGSELYNFLLFDVSCQVVKSFDNHVIIERNKPLYFVAERAMKPFSISESIYVKENSNDTLYCLSEQNKLIPQYVFDLGQYVFSKEKREATPNPGFATNNLHGVIQVPDYFIPLVGTPHHIFFSFNAIELPKNIPFPKKKVLPPMVFPADAQNIRYIESHSVVGIYDFVDQKTWLLDTDPVSRIHGLINDLDGGLSFWPRYYTSDNELVSVWQAYKMKEILSEEYFMAHEIKNPQAHQKLKELLKNLDEEDNPVIVIGKLK